MPLLLGTWAAYPLIHSNLEQKATGLRPVARCFNPSLDLENEEVNCVASRNRGRLAPR